MFAPHGRQRLMPFGLPFAGRSVAIAPAAGIVAGGLVAIAFLAMPIVVIEDMAMDSGVAAMLTAAAPPFGLSARLAVAFFAALAAGGVVWFGMFLMFGARAVSLGGTKPVDGVPVLRRADAHPDAPARRPVFANRDLGTPFLDVKAAPLAAEGDAPDVEPAVTEARDVPADLDTPIAAYRTPDDAPLPDPDPAPAPLPVLTPLSAPRFAPHERIETFGLAAADDEPSAPLPQATIHDLLERLERGVARRQPEAEPTREQTLEETLDALRALARRVG